MGFLQDMAGILAADAPSGTAPAVGYSSGSDFYNSSLANSDILNQIDSGVSSSNYGITTNSTFSTPTFAPSTYGGPSVVNASNTPSLTTALENLIPTAFNTASSILKTQYSVPQTSPGQYYTQSANGAISTGTLSASQQSILGSSGGSSNLLLLGGAAVLLVVLMEVLGKK